MYDRCPAVQTVSERIDCRIIERGKKKKKGNVAPPYRQIFILGHLVFDLRSLRGIQARTREVELEPRRGVFAISRKSRLNRNLLRRDSKRLKCNSVPSWRAAYAAAVAYKVVARLMIIVEFSEFRILSDVIAVILHFTRQVLCRAVTSARLARSCDYF